MSKNMNVPKLRFSEFSDEWEEKVIKNIASIVGGGTPDTTKKEYWNGNIEWFTPTEIKSKYISGSKRTISELGLKKSSAKILPKGTLLLSTRATVGDVGIALEECTTNQGFQSLIINENNCNEFLYNWILTSKKEFLRKATGSTFLEISKKEIEKIKISIPSKQEQEKIASFLNQVDTKIEQLTRKEKLLQQYKKGVMQKIFNREIRFKTDDGSEFCEWEEKKLGEVFKRITTKNKEDNQNVLTISAQNGLINQEKYFNKSVSAKDVTGYYLLENGDFAYNKSYSKGYPMGAIKRLNNYEKGVVSTLYICFRINEKYDSSFYEKYFDSGFLNKELHKIAQEGARNHGLLNMSVVEFFNDIKIPVPLIKEQNKIANFLSSIDNKIEQTGKQLKQTKEFKKALLQQMFV
eukprot:Anaeramoba_flamelloidesa822958_24.p1 GENE.a822958_24~~a822958_24.p1  ORF type:complete len:407 (-),score=48.20 a822958_24:410-1630(-)